MRLIDADELFKKLSPNYDETTQLIKEGETHLDTLAEGYTEVSILINGAPTIEAEPVRHGHWIIHRNPWGTSFENRLECSSCRFTKTFDYYPIYCPNCGSKMDEAEK